MKVCDLISLDRQRWKMEVVGALVEWEDMELIQTILISRQGCRDK